MLRNLVQYLASFGGYPRLRAAGFALLVLAVVATACSAPPAAPAAAPTPIPAVATAEPAATQAATAEPAAAQPVAAAASARSETMAATVKVSQSDKLGQFLVDDQGLTLYVYTKDTKNTSNCYDKCAAAWPPLYTNSAPQAGTGADGSLLGTATRKDGKAQVTYNGWPLYYWVKDQKPGDTTGQDVGKVWYVISPKGDKVEDNAAEATATPMASMSSGDDTGYGKSSGSSGSGGAPAAGQPVKVAMTNFAFAPQTITVAVGTTVQWENDDSAAHTVTADDGSFDSGNMDQGAQFKFTFTKAGTYAYYCRYHGGPGGKGMAGQIVVK